MKIGSLTSHLSRSPFKKINRKLSDENNLTFNHRHFDINTLIENNDISIFSLNDMGSRVSFHGEPGTLAGVNMSASGTFPTTFAK